MSPRGPSVCRRTLFVVVYLLGSVTLAALGASASSQCALASALYVSAGFALGNAWAFWRQALIVDDVVDEVQR